MTKTATLEQVRQKCLDRQSKHADEVVSLKSLFMDPAQPGRLVLRRSNEKERDYKMDDRVFSQMSTVVYGLPGGYLETLALGEKGDPGLAAANFNHWIGKNKDREILCRMEDRINGDKDNKPVKERVVRALLPASWRPIPYDKSVEQLITKFGPDQECELDVFSDEQLVINIVTAELADVGDKLKKGTHIRIDDPFKFGFRFRDSDVGRGQLQLCPYTLRLRCTNGAYTISEGVSVSISHSGKEAKELDGVLSNLRQGVEMIGGYAEHIALQIDASRAILLDLNPQSGIPEAAMARLNRDNAITQLQDKYVREAWETEAESIPEPTVYRLANAYTRAGTHADELDDDKKSALKRVGGRVFELALSDRYQWN